MMQVQAETSARIRRTLPAVGRRPGTLVIAGSGIRAIAHLTLEVEAYIAWADVVYYCVADPATAKWILDRSPEAVDLYKLYDTGKRRIDTYIQMSELMLRSVRQGLNVVGIFYGHPGVFVNPSHRAIAIARQEGHAATMLPGVSAIDCLFADLGIDPSRPGCQILEATDVLLRRRPLLVDGHVIMFQVGSVGDSGFNFSGFPNVHLPVLIRFLQDNYGSDYGIYHYVASQYSFIEPIIERFTLDSILLPEIHRRISGISTFYIPPKLLRATDPEMAGKLGVGAVQGGPITLSPFYPADKPYTSKHEARAVTQLETHQPSADYRPARPSQSIYDLVKDLSLNPTILELYNENPETVIQSRCGISDVERTALLSGSLGSLRLAMQRTAGEVAEEFVRRAVRDPSLSRRYHAVAQASSQYNGAAQVAVVKALRQWGYDTTPEEISKASQRLRSNELGVWANSYEVVVNGTRVRGLRMSESGVTLGDEALAKCEFASGELTWKEGDGNISNGVIAFFVVTDVGGEQLPPGAYIGPQFRGRIWERGAERPDYENAYGKVGVYSADKIASALEADPLDFWAGEYTLTVLSADGGWTEGPRLRIETFHSGLGLAIDGDSVGEWSYSNGNLGWTQPEPRYSGSIAFHLPLDAGAPPAEVVGRIWRGPEYSSPLVNVVGRRLRS